MVLKCAPHKARMYQDAHWFRPHSLGRGKGKGIKDYFGTKPESKMYKVQGKKSSSIKNVPVVKLCFFILSLLF